MPQPSPKAVPRPPVSVVAPFTGSGEQARALISSLGRIATAANDELLIADNSRDAVVAAEAAGTPVRVVRADREGSPAHARNSGAAAARGEWILFMDADCEPEADVIEAYFRPLPGEGIGALAGAIDAAPSQRFAARWAASRRYLDQRTYLDAAIGPGAITPNLLVRRAAFEAIGGFREGIYSGEDLELSWRLADAGWQIEYRDRARVSHHHRETVRAALAQARRCGAGNAWQNEVRPGSSPRPRPVRESTRALARSLVSLGRGRPAEARFALMDGAIAIARARGYREPNDAAPLGGRG